MNLMEGVKREFSFIKGNYAVLVLSWVLVDFATEIPTAYYILYVLKLGATETIVGLIGLSQFLALASMQFPGGYLADKFGRKWIISSMTFGVTLSFILYALAPSWHFILIGAVLMGVCNSTYQPALGAMVADSLPPERRGMGFGIVTLIASASTTPAPAVAVYLCNAYGLVDGMRVGYGIVVTLFMIAAFFRLFRLKETVVSTERPHLSDILKSYPVALKESVLVWKRVPRSLLYLSLTLLMVQFGFSTANLYMPDYAINRLLIDKTVWGLMIAVSPITTIALAIPIGKTVDKTNRKIPLLLSLLLFGGAIWLFAYGQFVLLFVSLIMVGAAQVMVNTAVSSMQADMTPRDDRGKVSGFTNFVGYVVMAIGNFLGGVLYEHVAPSSPFMIAAASVLPAFVFSLLLVHEPKKREE
jgi:MFS family permease